MIVSYPMYALSQMQDSLNFWWESIHKKLYDQGINIPISFSQTGNDLIQHWLNPDLLLSQTCGYPLVAQLKSQVKLIGTPIYSAQGCEGPDYSSFFVARKNDPRSKLRDYVDGCFAYNSTDSQSGFNAVRVNLLEKNLPTPFFGESIESGGHRNSILMVAKGKADICAVDCVTYSLLELHQPEALENVRILCSTRKTPGLPLITSINTDDQLVDALFNTIKSTCQDESMKHVNDNLLLKGIEKVDLDSYYQAVSQPDHNLQKL